MRLCRKGLGMDGISGAAMMYMMATDLVSLMENINQKSFKKTLEN